MINTCLISLYFSPDYVDFILGKTESQTKPFGDEVEPD